MEDNEGCLWIFIVGGIVGLLILGTIVLGYWSDATTCNQRYASFEHKYGFFSGCLIKVNGKWVPDESFYVKEDIR